MQMHDDTSGYAKLTNWVNQLDIRALGECYGTPAWIVSESQLVHNVDLFAQFTGFRNRILYPVKTNPSLTVLELLASMGVGVDCASRAEVDLALLAGFAYDSISYNSPVQDIELCKSLLECGSRVVMDDPEAIFALQETLIPHDIKGNLILRLNLPDYGEYAEKNANQELMAHGHKSSKFGIPVEDLEWILQKIVLPVTGLHVHVGTQMDNLLSFEFAMRQMHEWADKLCKKGYNIREINLGGGLGIPFTHSDRFPSLDTWVQTLSSQKNSKYVYFVEPGHALVGNAVALLMSVQAIKQSRGKKWAITDVGTDQLAKVTLLRWPHRIFDASGTELPAGVDAIAGPLCFTGDTLLENISVSGLSKGDPLLLAEAGAYTYSLANRFNGRIAPKWLVKQLNGTLVETMRSEDRYENPQLGNYKWQLNADKNTNHVYSGDSLIPLSSNYLRETSSHDRFSYTSLRVSASNVYEFDVSTISNVDFISMPFAIRIIGDAAIVAVLQHDGHAEKQQAVWGRRLVMDFFDQIPSNAPFKFKLYISSGFRTGALTTRSVRFESNCGRCVGSFIVVY